MNSFENPDPENESRGNEPESEKTKSHKGGVGNSLRKAFYGAMAGAMLGAAAHAEEGAPPEKTQPSKKVEGVEKQKDKLENAREELHDMLLEISGGQMKSHKGSFIVRFAGNIEINGKDVSSPSDYFRLEKADLEKIVNFVQEDFIEGKTDDRKIDRALRKSTLMGVKVKIAEFGKPVSKGDPALEGLVSQDTIKSIQEQMRGNSPKGTNQPKIEKKAGDANPDRPKPEKKTNPEVKDYL